MKRRTGVLIRYPCEDLSTIDWNMGVKRFGIERIVTSNSDEINFLSTEDNQISISSPEVFGHEQAYSIGLTRAELFPIKSVVDSNLFQIDWNLSDNERLWIQLLAVLRPPEWREGMLGQYECYLSGVDNPLLSAYARRLQTGVLKLLAKISGTSPDHDPVESIEQRIMDLGYECEIRFLAHSHNQEGITDKIKKWACTHDYMNSLYVHEEKENVVTNFIESSPVFSSFHISHRELMSFIGLKNDLIVPEELRPQEVIEEEEVVSEENKESLEKGLQKAIRRVGILQGNQSIKIISHDTGISMHMLTVTIPKNTTFSTFRKKVDDLTVAFGKSISVTKGKDPNTLIFMIPLNKRRTVYLDSLIRNVSFRAYAKKHYLPLCIGVDMMNSPIYEPLENAPHLLVAGATGSGKSVFMNSLIYTLIKTRSPEQVELYLVDPKLVEFDEFKRYSHVRSIATQVLDIEKLFRYLVEEMEKRYETLKNSGVKNIHEFNQKTGGMPYKVCVVDEYNDLLIQCPDIEQYIERLGQKARAAGIHLVIATQRPDSHVMSGTIKVNFPSRISFQLSNNNEYRTVFGTGIPFKNLLGKGDGVMSFNGEQESFIRFQSPVINSNSNKDPESRLKEIILSTGETRVKELQKEMGIGINTVNNLMKKLCNEGFIQKNEKGKYEIPKNN